MDTPRIVLLVFLFLFLFAFPDSQRPSASQQHELEHLLAAERQALDLLNSAKYADFDPTQGRWINVAGLRHSDQFAWDLLPRVQERARQQQRDILKGSSWPQEQRSSGSLPLAKDENGTAESTAPWRGVYNNVTGSIRGHWVRSRVADMYTPPSLNLTSLGIAYPAEQFKYNISGREGHLRFKLEEKASSLSSQTELVRELHAEMTIQDENSRSEGWELTLHGIHDLAQGDILLATTGQR